MTLALTSNLTGMVLSMQRAGTPSAGGADGAATGDTRLRSALTALESLTRPASDAAEERKAAAAKKVEALKARIKMLRMSGGDPVATAKAVAALARELGAAVKAYAAAGGGSAAAWVQTTTAPAAGQSAEPATGEQVATLALAEVEATDEKTQEAPASPTDPYRQTIERMQQDATDRARRNSSREAGAKFAVEARGLAAELKSILREAENKARRDGDPVSTTDQQAAGKALAQVTDAVAEISGMASGAGPMVGVSISV